MATVELKQRRFADADLTMFQTDVEQAVAALSLNDQPTIKVAQVSANITLSGDEDFLLVDMSGAIKDVFVLLPAPGSMTRSVTISITNQGKRSLFVKGSDTGDVTINGQTQIKVTGSTRIVATPTQFFTV
jgi:hypothetical protein